MRPADGARHPAGGDDLRAAVRAVLREVLPPAVIEARRSSSAQQPADAGGDVAVRTDAELDTLVRRVAALCEDPAQRAALREGRHRFRLTGSATGADSAASLPGPGAANAVVRVDRGAVTERLVKKAAADGARLVLARGAVLTPLARDRARVLGVQVEREER